MGTKSLYDGLEYKSPKNDGDSSRTLQGKSVNAESTRSSPSSAAATLGPRSA